MSTDAIFVPFIPTIKKESFAQWGSLTPLKTVPSWMDMALQNLQQLKTLPNNWDGNGSGVIDAAAIEAAQQLLAKAPLLDVPAPHITGIPGGGVGFHWRIEDRDLEIEVSTRGAAEYLKTMIGSDTEPDEGVIEDLEDSSVWNWLTESLG